MRNYKLRILCLLMVLLTGKFIAAQSKLVDTKQSAVTGLSLPEGSKQDKRFLSVSAAKMLLELISKKAGATIKTTEVLYLSLTNAGGFTMETLKTTLQQSGWSIRPVDEDPEYVWLDQNGKTVLAYLSTTKKEINLYFGETAGSPAVQPQGETTQQQTTQQQQTTTTQDQTTTQEQTTQQQQTTQQDQQQVTQVPTTPVKSGYAFNISNFDDGWTSTVQEDWVEVTKGNIKVLLHYPKEGTIIPADPEPHVNNAWNILTAPRYSNLRNYRTAYIQTYNRPYFGMGTLTDNATGKDVFVVLFRQGQSGWIEFIMPDKNDFIQQYRFDPETIGWNSESDLMNPLVQMSNYNKFAVAASDFSGTWTSDFTGVQQLYHVYTGNYGGMLINQSKEVFEFTSSNSYKWNLLVINGMVGATNYAQVKSTGKLQVINNWQITCSDIEGKPKKYHAFFSCIKGARLLKLLDADFPGSGIPTVFGKK